MTADTMPTILESRAKDQAVTQFHARILRLYGVGIQVTVIARVTHCSCAAIRQIIRDDLAQRVKDPPTQELRFQLYGELEILRQRTHTHLFENEDNPLDAKLGQLYVWVIKRQTHLMVPRLLSPK